MKNENRYYNTETSTLVYQISNHLPTSHYRYCEENFYKTQSGKYFLHAVGGAGSKYRTGKNSSTYKGKEIVIPCTEKYYNNRVKADEMGFVEDDYKGDEFFRYTKNGDIEFLDIDTGKIFTK